MTNIDLRAFLRRIPGFLHPPGTVLYVGANPGQFSGGSELYKAGHEITLLEAWPENAEAFRDHRLVAHVVQGDVREVNHLPLPRNEYDIVFWWHGPEHIERDEVAGTLAKLEALARMVMVGCPWGVYPQGALKGNPYQVHRCALYPKDLEALGYNVASFGRRDDLGGRLVAWKDKEVCMDEMYRALMRLYHTDENRFVEVGETVSLAHLEPGSIKHLIDTGRVAPVRQRRVKKQEVTNGSDDDGHDLHGSSGRDLDG